MRYIKIAKHLLDANDTQDLHPDLEKYLHQSDRMCRNANGHLTSRQAIMVLIRLWQTENRAVLPLVEKKSG